MTCPVSPVSEYPRWTKPSFVNESISSSTMLSLGLIRGVNRQYLRLLRSLDDTFHLILVNIQDGPHCASKGHMTSALTHTWTKCLV